MKYFFDTEFIEDGKTIDLISIGIVADDQRELHLCNSDAQLHLASDWVRQNVLPHLPPYGSHEWQPKRVIAERVQEFVLRMGEPNPEFWAYHADYDWVALCQLYGRMIDLPERFPKYCMDLKQWSKMLGSPTHPKQKSSEHHALADAQWNRDLHAFLSEIAAGGKHPNS